MKAINQYVVAPGSRHVAGGYYRYADGSSPEEVQPTDLPDYLRVEIERAPSKQPTAGARKPCKGSDKHDWITQLPPPGELRPDSRVLGALRHHRVGGAIYRGEFPFNNPSKNDMRLADLLAFYTCHNVDQALRLFLASPLYRPNGARQAL